MTNDDFSQGLGSSHKEHPWGGLEDELRQALAKEKMVGLSPDQLSSLYTRIKTRPKKKTQWLVWTIPAASLVAARLAIVIVSKAPPNVTDQPSQVAFGEPPAAEPPAAEPPAANMPSAAAPAAKVQMDTAQTGGQAAGEFETKSKGRSKAEAPNKKMRGQPDARPKVAAKQWETANSASSGQRVVAPELSDSAQLGEAGLSPTTAASSFDSALTRDQKPHALILHVDGKTNSDELPITFVASVRSCITSTAAKPSVYELTLRDNQFQLFRQEDASEEKHSEEKGNDDRFTRCILRSAELHRQNLPVKETLRIQIIPQP